MIADVAELADASDLGSGDLTVVGVQISPSALTRFRFLTNSLTWIEYLIVRQLCFYKSAMVRAFWQYGPVA